MRRYLLDTNTISEATRRDPDPEVLMKLRDYEGSIALAAPVWHELTHGVELLPPSSKRRAIEHFLTTVVRPSFPILPYDDVAAEWHGRERARLTRMGLQPPFVDGQIAAIAKVNDRVLVTANVKDFQNFADLDLENWISLRIRGSAPA